MNIKIKIKNLILEQGFSEVRYYKEEMTQGSIIIAAFPYERNKTEFVKGVKISPFAQKDHYGEAVKRLKKVALFIREEKSLQKKDIRIFCNSQLKEKWYAANSGLGFYGRNSLIITEKYGSRVILAGLIVPFDIEADVKQKGAHIPGNNCGKCQACVVKCPTSAIEDSGFINRDKCLQSLTTDDRILPKEIMDKWGNRLYGCSICQDCCPFNKNSEVNNMVIKGDLGESIPFEKILTANDEELKILFKGSALSMSWIRYDLLRRNAIISAVSEKRFDLIELIERYISHNYLSYTAKWSIEKLRNES